MCLFAIKVLSQAPGYLNIWILDGVFIFPILANLISSCQRGIARPKWMLVAMVIALILEVIGIVIITVFELTALGLNKRLREIWVLPVSLLSVSAAWIPQLLQKQLLPTKKSLMELLRGKMILKRRDPIGDTFGDSTSARLMEIRESINASFRGSGHFEGDPLSNEDAYWVIMTYPQLSARWKNNILQSVIKIILTIGFCLLFGYIFNVVDIKHLTSGFHLINSRHENFNAFIANIACGFVAYLLGWMACTICLQKQCFALPLGLASPVCLTVSILDHRFCMLPQWVKGDCGTLMTEYLQLILPAAICLILAQILSTLIFIFKTQTIVMQLESHVSIPCLTGLFSSMPHSLICLIMPRQLFWQPGYNSLFLEQWMLLNRKNVQTFHFQEEQVQQALKSRVFICTTMYREVLLPTPHPSSHLPFQPISFAFQSATEMSQLLDSLRAVNVTKQKSGRHFQAHIFFDNGVRDTKLTQFACQLVSCIKMTLGE